MRVVAFSNYVHCVHADCLSVEKPTGIEIADLTNYEVYITRIRC